MPNTDTADIATRLAAVEQELRRRDSAPARYAAAANALDLDAYTIAQFCARHNISRATYYVLKKRDLQPAETRVLDRIIISKESAAAWRKKRAAESRRRRA